MIVVVVIDGSSLQIPNHYSTFQIDEMTSKGSSSSEYHGATHGSFIYYSQSPLCSFIRLRYKGEKRGRSRY
jgi:hypothetical protein